MSKMFTVVLLVLCFGGVAVGRQSEPQCSQFDFVERTLEKVIKSEYKMIEFEQRINDTLRKMEEIIGSKTEQMAEMEQSVQTAIAELSERGSRMVAFNVHGLVDLSLSTDEVIRFTKVHINIGNGYDTDTGKFTSPIEGVFLFSVTLCTNPDKYLHYAITQNGNTNLVKTALKDDDTYSCGSAIAVADLKAGDQVWVKSTTTYANNIFQNKDRSNTFVGTLLG